MAEREINPWATSSGLPDAFTGPIKDAYFGYDDAYQDGEVCVLTVEVLADDADIGEDGLIKMLYPCGKGFEPKNKGKNVEHESGKYKPFNNNSGMGLLIDAGLEVMGDALVSRGMPTDTETWIGLAFDWERKEFSGTFGGEKSTWNRVLPVAVAAGGVSKSKGNTKATTKTAAPEADGGSADGEATALPFKIKAALKKIAAEHDNHDNFMEAAYDAASEMDGWDEAFESHITDSGEGSIWQSAQG